MGREGHSGVDHSGCDESDRKPVYLRAGLGEADLIEGSNSEQPCSLLCGGF